MKKPLLKTTRFDDTFHFFLHCSSLASLMVAILAVAWGERVWGGAAIFLLLFVIGGADGWLALLQRKPKIFPLYGACLKPRHEGYAESDALLTEMEIPYYEYHAIKKAQTTNRKLVQLTT